jgi:hypothetical protein
MYTIAWFGIFSGKNNVFGGKAPSNTPEKMRRATVPLKNKIGFLP